MKLNPHLYLAIAFIFLASCTSSEMSPKSQSAPTQAKSSPKVVTLDKNFKTAMGQTIYVPVYSYIYHDEQQRILNLAATLSIRNTDLNKPIIITSVRYYDSDGKLVKQYLEQPIQLNALASSDFFISRTDNSGGLGANFIVEWVAQTEVSEPIVEAVMIATEFQQGVSFISPGKVIKSQKN
ncbi:DUF3124 domain-containing protein [Chlorogloeopsis fritschii PCC 9212]|uniref:DUF3124 domain-containing protein n=1 Tax=Chlorogloeopsis fritschii PCC 6912 TaxID=211165 RepID=A0A433NDL5_CHLFR|nr:DUF3124 domain-containing protein [Chlorogloeopsis fritschii]RUR80197.1 hypothetical protein PCC6912_30570 [Chlorogloeopsis fritschii PCC 6912]